MSTPSGTGESPRPRAGDEPAHGAGDPEPADLAQLRAILVGPERQGLARLQARLDDPEARARDVGDVLPNILLQHAQDPHFTRALAPSIEKALTASVRRDPQPLSDALFPVMGPAIRKAVASALSGMIDSLNRTLEYSLSWKSLRWRLEARRTGRSFGEVVLLKTLVYRVEQVFLIDRSSGLLIQHVHHGGDNVQDADMVSGMLTAIRDFVRDSFKVAEHDSLEALKVGDLSVWVEPGPRAILAAMIRGSAPREYRRTLQDAVETIHLQFAEPLETFNGDATALADAHSILEGCLESRFRPEERRPRTAVAWTFAGVIAVLAIVAGVYLYRAQARWTAYVAALRAEPGLVVVEASGSWRRVVSGLRDPLAHDPRALLGPAGLDADAADLRFAPYYSLDPVIVASRAATVLRPPAGVTLVVEDGVLSAEGNVSVAWAAEAVRTAPLVPGVARFDAAGALGAAIRDTITAIESRPILFAKGSASPAVGERPAVEALVSRVSELATLASATGLRFQLDIVGHTDDDGAPEANVPLSRMRAQAIAAAVGGPTVGAVDVMPRGVGSAEPAVSASTEADNQRNRRVAIRVTRLEAP